MRDYRDPPSSDAPSGASKEPAGIRESNSGQIFDKRGVFVNLVKKDIKDIFPYANNPRKNDSAVDAVAESIRQCGYIAPIIVDEDGVILAGHTRYKALKKLGRDWAEVIVKDGLTEEQKKKYRLLDNKTGELASWDFDLLSNEIEGLDFEGLSLGWEVYGISDKELNDLMSEEVEMRTKKKTMVVVETETNEEAEAVANVLKENGYSPRIKTS